jgi:ubiquinone/menaquinone biosynthesis C-methylase UbiE
VADDPYRITDQVDDDMLQMMINRLEERGKDDQFVSMMDDYLNAIEIDKATAVLDLGCGTGVVARRIASRSGFRGTVNGIDLALGLIEKARDMAAEEKIADCTIFEVGDTRSLEKPDSAYDATILHTLVSHLENPDGCLIEAARVTRSGGAICVFDGDYASSTLETSDASRAAELDQAMIDATVTQPRVMRRLPRMAKSAGLQIERVFPYLIAEVGKADFFSGMIRTLGPMLVSSGIADEHEAEEIASDLQRACDEGTFFGACAYYGYVLRKR